MEKAIVGEPDDAPLLFLDRLFKKEKAADPNRFFAYGRPYYGTGYLAFLVDRSGRLGS